MNAHISLSAIAALATAAMLGPKATATPGKQNDYFKGSIAVVDNDVLPSASYVARVRVLGVQITSSGDPVPVTMRVNVGDDSYEPFGAYGGLLDLLGNLNEKSYPVDATFETMIPAGTPISVDAMSWVNGKEYLAVNSSANSSNVIILKNGDQVPNYKPFDGQTAIQSMVAEHIDKDGIVTLYPDEVIMLFELGTTNLTSTAADFQDLIVLVTFGESTDRFDYVRVPPLLIFD